MDLYRGNNDFKKGYQPRTDRVKDEEVMRLQTFTVFWVGGSTISLCYWMYVELMALDTQEMHKAEPLVPELNVFDVQLVIEKTKFTNHRVLIRTQQN